MVDQSINHSHPPETAHLTCYIDAKTIRRRLPITHADTNDLEKSLRSINEFIGAGLSARIAELEHAIQRRGAMDCQAMAAKFGATSELLAAAHSIKQAAGQINVIIHSVGGLLLISKILEPGELIEYVSLGAGNSGRAFDLETDRRVAEFKFIHWRGGAESIRQNALFKDFYMLAEHQTVKRKELYVLGTMHVLRFLQSRRALKSVMSRNNKLWEGFQEKYGMQLKTVNDYYRVQASRKVQLVDASTLVPELARIVGAGESEQVLEKL